MAFNNISGDKPVEGFKTMASPTDKTTIPNSGPVNIEQGPSAEFYSGNQFGMDDNNAASKGTGSGIGMKRQRSEEREQEGAQPGDSGEKLRQKMMKAQTAWDRTQVTENIF
ncbi:hypothetical protein VKT23_012685 [Stygiomarasmius scandens]|uniref:Uncharacterized protein n=1 Tax=Marasmiellus scandens TaxID=2682957 RepID=A0ABR1J657_9AGAR